MERRRSRPRPARLGFTMVELLVVVLIIATLIAILLPAINGAVRRAREAQVSAEMNNLATALASFKNSYGDFPPSRVVLHEMGFGAFTPTGNAIAGPDTSNNSDQTDTQLIQRSKLYMQRFFPRVNFNVNFAATGTVASPANGGQAFFDFNGDGVANTANYILLNGSECLAFFLGGLPIHGTDSSGNSIVTGVSGFNRSPVNPFIAQQTLSNGVTLGSNRTQPNFEFVTGRLVDLDGDGMPSYLDPFDTTVGNQRAYAYFSAYGVNGYDPNDVNGYDHLGLNNAAEYEMEDDPNSGASVVVERGFLVNFPVYGSGGTTAATFANSPAPNPYTSGQPAVGTVAWQNPNSYQLLSAGADRQWGLGGIYVQNSPTGNPLPQLPQGMTTGTDPGLTHAFDADTASPKSDVRQRENDNLTNFSGGRLQ